MQTKYETEKKEQQNRALKTENELSAKTIRQQTIITYVTIAGLALALILAFFIFRGLKQQRLTNKIISEQKAEVELQKHLVEEHQKEILDSIRYAKRIQKAHLPTESYVKRNIDRLKKSDL
jgi:cell division protein FtsX